MVVEAVGLKPADACSRINNSLQKETGKSSGLCDLCIHKIPDNPDACDPSAKLVLRPDVPFNSVLRRLFEDAISEQILQKMTFITLTLNRIARSGNPEAISAMSIVKDLVNETLALQEIIHNPNLSIPIGNRYTSTPEIRLLDIPIPEE